MNENEKVKFELRAENTQLWGEIAGVETLVAVLPRGCVLSAGHLVKLVDQANSDGDGSDRISELEEKLEGMKNAFDEINNLVSSAKRQANSSIENVESANSDLDDVKYSLDEIESKIDEVTNEEE